ncbi:MAG: DedA family protein [Actinobacteria bacterium]|nr:DedA family protein [Actinomycetota bacterium]
MDIAGWIESYGPPVVFIMVFLGAFIVPYGLGELSIVTAAALAQEGNVAIQRILGAAIVAAILGQAAAYGLARWRGRQILESRFLGRLTRRPLATAEAFFLRHGGKAVFLGRYVPVLRTAIGWVAGVTGMPVGRYLAWNISGAVTWALVIGLPAYFFGKAAAQAVSTWGTLAVVVIVVGALTVIFAFRLWGRRSRVATADVTASESFVDG